MRVKFVRDEEYEFEGRHKGHTFKAGEVYELDEDFAQRWVRRGAVEVLDGGPPAPEKRFQPVAVIDAAEEPLNPPAADKAAADKAAADKAAADKAAADKAAAKPGAKA